MNAMVAGQVDDMCDQIVNAVHQVTGGTIKAYAVATPERNPSLPDVPTTKEAGLPECQAQAWNAIFAPKGTSPEIVANLTAAADKALDDETVKKRLLELGSVIPAPADRTPQALGKLVAFDLAVSRSRFAEFRERALCLVNEMIPSARVCDFGHLGDGGVHLNVVVPIDAEPASIERLRDAIYDLTVSRFDGSYSAEHGVGPYNAAYYDRFTNPLTRKLARVLKGFLDPDERLGNTHLA